MNWLKRLIEFLTNLIKGKGKAMTIDAIVGSVVDKVEEKLKTDNELVDTVVSETGDFIKSLGQPAVELGTDYVKAILFGAAAEIENPVPDLTPEQLAALSIGQAADHQEKRARRAEQIEKITRAEAEHQAAAREVRDKTTAFLSNLLGKVGSIGIKMLAASLI